MRRAGAVVAAGVAAGLALRSAQRPASAMVGTTTTSVAALASAPLKTLPGAETALSGAALWKDKPSVVLVVRRPGWVMCRAEAKKLWAIKPQLDSLGVGLCAVLKENIPKEVAEFNTEEFWPGPVYLDEQMVFFKALGGGTVRKGNLLGLVGGLINPWSSTSKITKEANALVKNSNFKGEGTILGGLYVVDGKRDDVVFQFVEKDFGVHAAPEDVIAAANEAVRA